MVLFLFSIGVTKGKWGTLINTLLDFKRDYDANAPLAEALPRVLAAAPARYAGMGVKDLGDAMWAELRAGRMGHWEAQAYAQLPVPQCTPRAAFQKLMAGEVDLVPLEPMADRGGDGRRDSVPAGYPDRDAGREHRAGRRRVDQLPARVAALG